MDPRFVSFPVRRAVRHVVTTVLAVVLLAALAGCGGDARTVPFDPAAPCPAEGQQPGAYPELEKVLPTTYDGRPPDAVDSGRMCSSEALGTLAGAGISEVRFAGATWRTGGTSGLTVALFSADGLDATRMLDFYATPAESARRTEKLVRSDTKVGAWDARRLDVLGSDETGQTIVTWQEQAGGPVFVLLAADLGDANVAAYLDELGSR